MTDRQPEASQKFAVLCDIVRAQHFAWRRAVEEACPSVDPSAVVLRMWRLTGEQTGRAYLRRIDRSRPLGPQLARSIAWSSQCMGEDAAFEPGASDEEGLVRHRSCPWDAWHGRHALREECRRGCDEWFRATCAVVGAETGTDVRFETLESLPEGGASCLRRITSAPR
ncbi:MAG: hypothetical protein HY909_12960 [Deltaproteobacteria bacterium]|nr:hypothetical protein [Deltaproteobacteria bacterium]